MSEGNSSKHSSKLYSNITAQVDYSHVIHWYTTLTKYTVYVTIVCGKIVHVPNSVVTSSDVDTALKEYTDNITKVCRNVAVHGPTGGTGSNA